MTWWWSCRSPETVRVWRPGRSPWISKRPSWPVLAPVVVPRTLAPASGSPGDLEVLDDLGLAGREAHRCSRAAQSQLGFDPPIARGEVGDAVAALVVDDADHRPALPTPEGPDAHAPELGRPHPDDTAGDQSGGREPQLKLLDRPCRHLDAGMDGRADVRLDGPQVVPAARGRDPERAVGRADSLLPSVHGAGRRQGDARPGDRSAEVIDDPARDRGPAHELEVAHRHARADVHLGRGLGLFGEAPGSRR